MKIPASRTYHWIPRFALGVIVTSILIFEGCASSLEREEAKVYAAYVDRRFKTVASSKESLKRHVICDHTAGFQVPLSWRYAVSHLSVAPRADTVDDFLARNDGNYPESSLNEQTMKVVGRYPLNPHIKFRLPHVLISDSMIEKIISKPNGEGWQDFNRRYKKNHGILWLSRVGFSGNKSEALLYVGNAYGEGSADGMLILLRKQKGIWQEVDRYCCWIS